MKSRWEQIQDWALLAVLLALSLGLMVLHNEPMVRALRAASLEITARVESRLAWVGTYFRALEANSELRAENIALTSTVARSRAMRRENAHLRRMMGLQDTSDYDLQAARIISKDLTQQRNFFTINLGAEDSIEVGMAVLNQQGILGKVVLVSRHYARVMSYLNTDFRVPAKIVPLQAQGIIRWTGERSDRLLMEHVVKTEPVLPGQLVVTSGSSGVFPAGWPIGFVDSLAVRRGRNEYRIFVRPLAPLDAAHYAFVVMRTPAAELTALERAEIH